MTGLLTSILAWGLLQAGTEAPSAKGPDPEALELIDAFRAQLYDPLAAGLESLAFDAELLGPLDSPVGVVHVSWVRGQAATLELQSRSFVQTEALPEGMAELAIDMLEKMMEQRGLADRLIRMQTNSMLRNIDQATVPRVAGHQGDLIRVVCPPLAGAEVRSADADIVVGAQVWPVVNRVLRFDRKGRLAETVVVTEVRRAQGVRRERVESRLQWVAVPGSGGRLVLGTSRQSERTTVFLREDVGGFPLVTRMRSWPKDASKRPLQGSAETLMNNFVVNGVPIER